VAHVFFFSNCNKEYSKFPLFLNLHRSLSLTLFLSIFSLPFLLTPSFLSLSLSSRHLFCEPPHFPTSPPLFLTPPLSLSLPPFLSTSPPIPLSLSLPPSFSPPPPSLSRPPSLPLSVPPHPSLSLSLSPTLSVVLWVHGFRFVYRQ